MGHNVWEEKDKNYVLTFHCNLVLASLLFARLAMFCKKYHLVLYSYFKRDKAFVCGKLVRNPIGQNNSENLMQVNWSMALKRTTFRPFDTLMVNVQHDMLKSVWGKYFSAVSYFGLKLFSDRTIDWGTDNELSE